MRKDLGADLKLIWMIRDPIDWAMSFRPLTTVDKFKELLHKHTRNLCLANYLEAWLKVFPREQMLFLETSEYFADSRATLGKTLKFLGVPPYDYSDEELKSFGRRRSTHTGIVTDEIRTKWHADSHNRECKKRLEVLTGITFKWKGADP